MSPARAFALIIGLAYAGIGIAGFGAGGSSLQTTQLAIFDVNFVHNLVHLAIGGFGLLAYALGAGTARVYGQTLGVVLAVVGLSGLLPQPLVGVVPVGGADIALHLVTAALALYAVRLEPLPEV